MNYTTVSNKLGTKLQKIIKKNKTKKKSKYRATLIKLKNKIN